MRTKYMRIGRPGSPLHAAWDSEDRRGRGWRALPNIGTWSLLL